MYNLKDGELTIHLNISINLSGEIQNNQSMFGSKKNDDKAILKDDDEKTLWEIPDFSSAKNKINFGK